MKLRSVLHYLLFALLLIFSQQQVATHAISHFGASTQNSAPDHSLPADLSCDQCLAAAALGAALGSSFQADFSTHFAHASLRADVDDHTLPAAYRLFNSRAPPSLTQLI
ncbi:MAG TPA: hypothetical protein PLW86_04065 [Rhodocyclaceae bacterium]|nr:hypothetical protein [Rhodocyclaceae bacterium]